MISRKLFCSTLPETKRVQAQGVKENIKHIIRSSLTLKKININMNINTNINTTLFCTIDGIFMNQIHISEVYKAYWIDRETRQDNDRTKVQEIFVIMIYPELTSSESPKIRFLVLVTQAWFIRLKRLSFRNYLAS